MEMTEHEIVWELLKTNPHIPAEYHPIVALAELAYAEDTPTALRVQCHKEVAAFLMPKRKSLDITVQRDEQPQVIFYLPEKKGSDDILNVEYQELQFEGDYVEAN